MDEIQQTFAKVVSQEREGGHIEPTDMVRANVALRAARRQRGEVLASISASLLSVAEVLELAASDEGEALRRIRISSVLAELGCPRRRVDGLLDMLRRLACADPRTPDRRLTVGWICDRRSSGRRQVALCEILVLLSSERGTRLGPVVGYPYRCVLAPDRSN